MKPADFHTDFPLGADLRFQTRVAEVIRDESRPELGCEGGEGGELVECAGLEAGLPDGAAHAERRHFPGDGGSGPPRQGARHHGQTRLGIEHARRGLPEGAVAVVATTEGEEGVVAVADLLLSQHPGIHDFDEPFERLLVAPGTRDLEPRAREGAAEASLLLRLGDEALPAGDEHRRPPLAELASPGRFGLGGHDPGRDVIHGLVALRAYLDEAVHSVAERSVGGAQLIDDIDA